jgi:hypothetical protein
LKVYGAPCFLKLGFRGAILVLERLWVEMGAVKQAFIRIKELDLFVETIATCRILAWEDG